MSIFNQRRAHRASALANTAATDYSSIFPLALTPALIAESPKQLAEIIANDSDEHVGRKTLQDPGAFDTFQMECDALAMGRMYWRCRNEMGGDSKTVRRLIAEIGSHLCEDRGWKPDAFAMQIENVRERIKAPFGVSPLAHAASLAEVQPIRLIVPNYVENRIVQRLAAIAIHLQGIVGKRTIQLPTEKLGEVFRMQPGIISGAIKWLVRLGIVTVIDPTYHIGKAIDYRCVAIEGEHYDFIRKAA